MKKKQLYISLFLLLWFLFPQVNNALHYFVIEHHFDGSVTHKKQFRHHDKTHDCEQSIYKIPHTLLFDFKYAELNKVILFFETNLSGYHIFYTKIFLTNISNKGPPLTWLSNCLIKTIIKLNT